MSNRYLEKIAGDYSKDKDRERQLKIYSHSATGAAYGGLLGLGVGYAKAKPWAESQARKINPDLARKIAGKASVSYHAEHSSGVKRQADQAVQDALKHPKGSPLRAQGMRYAEKLESAAAKLYNTPVVQGRNKAALIAGRVAAGASAALGAAAVGGASYLGSKVSS